MCELLKPQRIPIFLGHEAVQKGLLPKTEIPQSTERAAMGNPGGSFDGALKAAQDVRCGRKRERRRVNPAFRERMGLGFRV